MIKKKSSNTTKEHKQVSKKKKIFKSPSAFSVLFVIIAIMAGLTWAIPSGSYERKDNGDSSTLIPGTYKQEEKVYKETKESSDGKKEEETKDRRQGLWDIFISPLKGMTSRLDVIMFVLVLGGFLGVVMKTKALDAAIGGLIVKMKGREQLLIPILMILFALGGTTYGMQEEAVAFYALVIPIMLAAGYNTMTAVMVIVLGAGSGVLASTVNPFSTGIAATSAQVPLGNILLAQGVILILSVTASIAFVMKYASMVKAGHYKEDTEKPSKIKSLDMSNIPKFTLERKFVMGIFALTFVVMVISLIPWSDFNINFFNDFHEYLSTLPLVGSFFGFEHSAALGKWYFTEISALFLISTVLIKILYHEEFKKEDVSVTETFLAGVNDLLSVALIIAVAAAIGEIMQAGGIQDTIVFWGEQMLKNVPSGLVGILAYIFYIPMSFIIPSSSGLASASMPIIAPVSELAGASREVAVIAFATASGLLNMVAPTIASLLAGLSIAGVSYKAWLKRVVPLMGVLVIISLAVIAFVGIHH